MRIAITGGSGALGRELARQLKDEDRVVIYSRSDSRQADMRLELPEGGERGLRYILGDIGDKTALKYAIRGCDYLVHAAAMKRIDDSEYNPVECVKVNVMGTVNVLEACIEENIKKAVFVSSDKAVGPVGVYGASKLMGECLWRNANNLSHDTEFVSVRYGNVLYSTQSIFYLWEKLRREGKPIPVTNSRRFYWKLRKAANFIRTILGESQRGVTYVPMMRSYSMEELGALYGKTVQVPFRCPEKAIEELIVPGSTTYMQVQRYAIYPTSHEWTKTIPYHGILMPSDWVYNSNYNVSKKIEDGVIDYIKARLRLHQGTVA